MVRGARWLKRLREEEERVKDADLYKTIEEVFDSATMGHIYRLEARGVIWELKGVVSAGKEARVYWGKARDGSDIAVKIYLTSSAEFRKSIRKYIMGDPRFESISTSNYRRLIYEWARKEYRNLKRMGEVGVRVPKPLGVSGNVIVMEFIGEEGYRAPLLVEAASQLSLEEARSIYVDVVGQVKRMVCEARLVHADLSEYNIMVYEGEPWIIDVSQAVQLDHPNALDFLKRDISNVQDFFSKLLGGEGLTDLYSEVVPCLREEGLEPQGST